MTPVVPTPTATEPTAAPWPEPWRSERESRPRTQYWDVDRACWYCDESATGAIPAPRSGD